MFTFARMNPREFTTVDSLGVIGAGTSFMASASAQSAIAVIAGLATVAAMLPLAIWRWRALFKGKCPGEVADGIGADNRPPPPCA